MLNSSTKSSKRACCCRKLAPAGLVVSSFKAGCMRSWRPFCCGLPGLIRSMSMPSLSHHTDNRERLNSALGLAKGTPLSVLIARGKPNSALEHGESVNLLGGVKRLTGQEVAAGEIGDRQRIAVALVGEHELTLVIGAPQVVRSTRLGEWCSLCPVSPSLAVLDQPVAVEHRVHG